MENREGLIERFNKKFVVNQATGCWEWTGFMSGRGTPTMWNGARYEAATRISIRIQGTEPTKRIVHSCENHRCVNPDHLVIGDRARFFSHVDRSGECWLWTGTKDGKGYGRFRVDSSKISSHRYAFREFSGAIPDGLQVLHRCDNPSCVRPEHLFLGTQKDNQIEMSMKKRQARQILSPNDVLQIRKLNGTMKARDIADQFGVACSTVYGILSGRKWSHLP